MDCWFWNIDKDSIDFFAAELDNGRLRQGWGDNSDADLRKIKPKVDANIALNDGENRVWARCHPMLTIKNGDLVAVKTSLLANISL